MKGGVNRGEDRGVNINVDTGVNRGMERGVWGCVWTGACLADGLVVDGCVNRGVTGVRAVGWTSGGWAFVP